MSASPSFTQIDWDGRRVAVEHAWLNAQHADRPLIVFLHEGLGSLAMWKDFPQRLCDAAHCRGLVYSRPGYGQSTPRPLDAPLRPDFMHRQAFELLPALFSALGINTTRDKPWLLGHSDGGSITLLHAARFASQVAGAIVMAPHILVEDLSITSITGARQAFEATDLKARLGKYHADPESTFRGWNDIWLHPEFRHWNITAELQTITAPLLAIQGLDDAYGTLAQIRGIVPVVPHTQLLEIRECGHSPHRDQPQLVIDAVSRFIAPHTHKV